MSHKVIHHLVQVHLWPLIQGYSQNVNCIPVGNSYTHCSLKPALSREVWPVIRLGAFLPLCKSAYEWQLV